MCKGPPLHHAGFVSPPPTAMGVGGTQWRRGRAGAVGRGFRERAEWAEPGSVTDSY